MGVGKYPSKFDTARSCREIGATYLGGDMLYGLLCTGYNLLLFVKFFAKNHGIAKYM